MTRILVCFSPKNLFLVLILLTSSLHAQFIEKEEGYGTNGVLSTVIQANVPNLAYGCVFDDEGRFLIVGQLSYVEAGIAQNFSFVTRFKTNGMVDSSFAVNGTWKAKIGINGSGAHDIVFHNNRILISGFSYVGSNMTELFAVALTEEGVLDTDFSDDGIFLTGVQSYILDCGSTSIAIVQEDKISLHWYSRYHTSLNGTLYIEHLLWNGRYDTSFDQDGKFVLYPIMCTVLTKPQCTYDADGSFMVIGKNTVSPFPTTLRWFNADGSASATAPIEQEYVAGSQVVKYDASGRCYIAYLDTDNTSMNLTRLKADKSKDLSFGTDGSAKIQFTSTVYLIENVEFVGDRIVLGGTVLTNGAYEAAIAVFHENGTPENSFGVDGSLICPAAERSFIRDLVYNPSSQELMFCGTSGNAYNIMLMKYKTAFPTTSVAEAEEQKTVALYLSSEYLFLKTSDALSGKAVVDISNLQGQVIWSGSISLESTGTGQSFFSQPLKPGIYLSRIRTGAKEFGYKSLVE